MEMLRKPMTEDENRRAVLASEKRRELEGHPEGNRHERRLAARVARREKKREAVR
jgi:hypothetical protein